MSWLDPRLVLYLIMLTIEVVKRSWTVISFLNTQLSAGSMTFSHIHAYQPSWEMLIDINILPPPLLHLLHHRLLFKFPLLWVIKKEGYGQPTPTKWAEWLLLWSIFIKTRGLFPLSLSLSLSTESYAPLHLLSQLPTSPVLHLTHISHNHFYSIYFLINHSHNYPHPLSFFFSFLFFSFLSYIKWSRDINRK